MKKPLPDNRVRCLVCGACVELGPGFSVAEFVREHDLCATLGMASAKCKVNGCDSTGIGRTQRCPTHGGKMEGRL